MKYKKVAIEELRENPFTMFSQDWALLSAGDRQSFNSMTVSWGGVGELWGRDVVFVFVRPQRYTREFMEKYDRFTLSFFDGGCKAEMGLCGRKSGRDTDKCAETGLVPVPFGDAVSFERAKTVLVCKKLAKWDLMPDGFLDSSIAANYAAGDYHRMYVGAIEHVYRAD